MKPITIILTMLVLVAIAPLNSSAAQAGGALNARDLYLEKDSEFLGLKCRLLWQDASGRFVPVKTDSIFHTNNHIRLEFESNAAGYLYVMQQGSDSTWQVLFPSAEISDNNNRIEPAKAVDVPRTEDFIFDETPGKERLFVVLTRNREPDLERLLALVRAQRTGNGAEDATVMPALFKTLSNKMSRDLLSRNLRISRTDQETSPNAQNETYVVSTEKAEARVVMEIVLSHER